MASYKGTVHTNKAHALIAKMLSGSITELEFTKIKVSDKDYSSVSDEELKKLTTLEQIKQETLISEKTLIDEKTINVHGIIYNTELKNSYYLKTIGVYANDPDEGEILYSITATDVGDYIPTPNGNNITTAIIDVLTTIDEAKVNLQGNPSALVDVSMLNKKLNKGDGLEEEFDSAVKIVTELKKKQNKEDSSLLTTVKNIVGAINELFSNKLEKGGYTGNAKNLNDEISKKASKTQLGRVIIGENLTIDENGRLSGNPSYTHPSGDGNSHLPSGGVAGQFIKWLSAGVGQWSKITKADIEDFDHNHDDRYYTETEIDTKFKNLSFVPTPVGGILLMYNTQNPSEIYTGTTWELLVTDKYLRTTTGSPLAIGGSNSVTITKGNLPNTKLQIESFNMTRGTMNINGKFNRHSGYGVIASSNNSEGCFYYGGSNVGKGVAASGEVYAGDLIFDASRSWTGNTSSASPYTTALGSGTPITVNPAYITVRAWKRLS